MILILSVIVGVAALISGFVWVIPNISNEVIVFSLTICSFSYAFFILLAIASISKSVFIMDRVTTDRIIGSICIYLLIGLLFAFLYAGISLLDHGAFSVSANEIAKFSSFLYFSLSSLTTTGFGDIVPTLPFTRVLTSFEGVVGSMYIAVVIARLIGMQISDNNRR